MHTAKNKACLCHYAMFSLASFAMGTPAVVAADIVSVGGDVVLREPPDSILLNQWESDTEIRGWFEREDTLLADLTLGQVESGVVDDWSDMVSGVVASGTVVQSYMVRLDPIAQGPSLLDGYLTFDSPILGVLVGSQISPTDSILGRPGISYNKNSFRGLELDGSDEEADMFTISSDRLRIDFTMDVRPWTDDIRIVTAAGCLADWNVDGIVDTRDFVGYLDDWASSGAVADINLDGIVDTRDFIVFLNLWSAGC